nr:immunoglobulin heavy chain junction region [Macaca mulatta]MOX63705.1 immunoglobulin heavy chain junction region [Macaca mulatta]MOX65517.1 immunoglobulin heavy chain junction region [Macaca mulatta]MOX65967.1 immunoglobulin heavy chain junction region [Macaca mulatta]
CASGGIAATGPDSW